MDQEVAGQNEQNVHTARQADKPDVEEDHEQRAEAPKSINVFAARP
jgi:hypothetical protein